jgi:hypothetical protein
MILVFQNDGTVRAIDSVSEANREYEVIDVENEEYTFVDDQGRVLKPVFREPAKKKRLFLFWVGHTIPFTLEPTNERRDDLLARVRSGEIPIDSESSGIRTLDDLQRVAPQLFRL